MIGRKEIEDFGFRLEFSGVFNRIFKIEKVISFFK